MESASQQALSVSVSAALGERARSQLSPKIATWLGLAAGICIPYFGLQQLPVGPARPVPVLGLDDWIPFQPAWVFAYLSLAALVPMAPLFAGTTRDLRRYAVGLAILCIPCFVAFAFYPVAGPRPIAPAEAPGAYDWLVGVDRPSNSMPSLHAGLALYSLLCGDRFLRSLLAQNVLRVVRGLGAAWGLAILYATLATKQHWAIDLPAGMALAWVGYAWSWRRR